MDSRPCVGCQHPVAPWQALCPSCLRELSKYWEENPLWVELYAAAGIREFEFWLTPDAETGR